MIIRRFQMGLGIWLVSGVAVGAILMAVTGEPWWIGIGAGVGTVMGFNTFDGSSDKD